MRIFSGKNCCVIYYRAGARTNVVMLCTYVNINMCQRFRKTNHAPHTQKQNNLCNNIYICIYIIYYVCTYYVTINVHRKIVCVRACAFVFFTTPERGSYRRAMMRSIGRYGINIYTVCLSVIKLNNVNIITNMRFTRAYHKTN